MELLRYYELRLLQITLPLPSSGGSLSPETQPSNNLYSLLNDLVASIESGDYLHVLSSEAAELIFHPPMRNLDNSVDSANEAYSEFISRVVTFLANDEDKACRVIIVMCIAIAAFLAFTQCNMTGPVEQLPMCPVQFKESKCEEFVEWDNWARNQLMESGSHLLGKFSYIQYIVFAKMLLMTTRDLLYQENGSTLYGVRSISWWLVRVTLIQQRILDERSSNLFDLLQVFTHEVLQDFGTFDKVTSYWGTILCGEEALHIASMAHLEAGVMEYTFGRVDQCRSHFESAEAAAGLQLSVTGVLGYRTVHQVEPKPQMVLVSNACSLNNGVSCPTVSSTTQDSDKGEDNSPIHQRIAESSDVMITPRLLENNDGFGGETQSTQISASNGTLLNGIQQTVILAQCLLIEKSTRHDDMQRWDMAPYIEALDSQQSSFFIIHLFRDILRIRWEATRNRTRERALLMMEKLVQGVGEPTPKAAERILFCYGVCVPTIPALRKEYGEFLVRFGLIGEAVKVFEELELWDNLIICYRLLEKKAAAVDLIKMRLSETPNDPRLWCSLGDVTNNDSCYDKALEVSNDRSARAKRSLARSAYNRNDYETSKVLWESALALNSLYPDGWFALGAAALKARDIDKALDGFTRAVQLDPENGEAWNNIACLHMIRKKNKEAFIAFKEALKFKRNSWQMWENYGHVALDVGNIRQAIEATQRVLELSSNKRIDPELLDKIVQEIETKECKEESRETDLLVELLGKTLQQIVKYGGGGDMWGLYSRWHRMKGDLTMCSEALLKQVRSYQGSDLWKDGVRFKKFALASLELCKIYMEISASTNSSRELFTAEMHLKNVIKQAESFSDTDEYKDLQNCLNEVRSRLSE